MTTLFTDLDNTLLYSHRHSTPEPKRWVEQLQGKPQGFPGCPISTLFPYTTLFRS